MPKRKMNGGGKTAKKTLKVEEGKASVSYFLSITKDLGGFESLKIQAGITVPHGASDELLEELDELLIVSKERVLNRISEDVDSISDKMT